MATRCWQALASSPRCGRLCSGLKILLPAASTSSSLPTPPLLPPRHGQTPSSSPDLAKEGATLVFTVAAQEARDGSSSVQSPSCWPRSTTEPCTLDTADLVLPRAATWSLSAHRRWLRFSANRQARRATTRAPPPARIPATTQPPHGTCPGKDEGRGRLDAGCCQHPSSLVQSILFAD